MRALRLGPWILILGLGWGAPVASGDADVHAELFASTLKAAREGDDATLRRLASPPAVVPWQIVDRLLADGFTRAAVTYAGALRQPDRDGLLRYARAPSQAQPLLRRAIVEAIDVLAAGDHEGVLGLLAARPPAAPSVLGWMRSHAIAESSTALGKLEDALASYSDMERVARELGWLRGQAVALHGRFFILKDEARFGDARATLRDLRLVAKAMQVVAEERHVDRFDAFLALREGSPRGAVTSLRRVISHFDEHGPLAQAAAARVHLATALGHLGRYAEALSTCERAAVEAGRAAASEGVAEEDAVDAAVTQRNAGYTLVSLLIDMGRYTSAIKRGGHLLKSGQLDPTFDATLRANLGLAFAATGDFKAAASSLEDARVAFQKMNEPEFVGWLHMYRALALHVERADWRAALTDATQGLAMLPAGTKDAAWAHFTAAVAHIGLGEWKPARARLDAARLVTEAQEILDLGASIHGRLAELELEAGRPVAAVKQAKAAMALMDESTLGLADEEDISVRSERERARIFRVWGRAARASNDRALEFEAYEAGRARLLVRAMGGSHLARGLDLKPELRARERKAQRVLVAARERYLLLHSRFGRSLRDKRVADARAAKDAAQTAFLDVITSIQRQAGSRAALAYPKAAVLKTVRKALASDEAIALYDVHAGAASVLVVTKAGARTPVLKKWPEVEAACETLQRSVGDMTREQYERPIAVIEQRLIQDLALPASIRRLYVSPAGPLTVVPWSSLPVARAARLDITVVPSATSLLQARTLRPEKGGRSLAMGDPLYEKAVGGRTVPWAPGSRYLPRLEHSGAESSKLIGQKGIRLLRAAASETELKRQLATDEVWDVVHLGCHGIVDDGTPGLTCVALSPTDEDDGFLTASELFALKLRAHLTVVSACDVGRAQHRDGVGLLGFVRAAMAAGCPRLLTSLWPADDKATSVLMTAFYTERSKGRSLHDALREAQEVVRTHKDKHGKAHWAAPYYWAGWIFWGAV